MNRRPDLKLSCVVVWCDCMLFLRVSDIPWPEEEEALSSSAQSAIEALLNVEPKRRPAAKGMNISLTIYLNKN